MTSFKHRRENSCQSNKIWGSRETAQPSAIHLLKCSGAFLEDVEKTHSFCFTHRLLLLTWMWCKNRFCNLEKLLQTFAVCLIQQPHLWLTWFSSVQFSRSVVSDSLRPHESQPPCPSPTPGVHSDSRPSSQWYPPAISSSVVPFSSCPQSLPASESFQWVNSSHEVAKVLEFQL